MKIRIRLLFVSPSIWSLFAIFFISSYHISSQNTPFSYHSILAEGDIYQLETDESGMYRIDSRLLQEELNIDIANLAPKNIQIFGMPPGALAEEVSDIAFDDLMELPILSSGLEDGSFDPDDYIQFFASAQEKHTYDHTNKTTLIEPSIYENTNYYFLKISDQTAKTIHVGSGSGEGVSRIPAKSTFYYGEQNINLLGQSNANYGSGQLWFDQRMVEGTLPFAQQLPDVAINDTVTVTLAMASRSASQHSATVTIYGNDIRFDFRKSFTGDVESKYASYLSMTRQIVVQNLEPASIQFSNKSATDPTWLDYILVDFPIGNNVSENAFTFFNNVEKTTAVGLVPSTQDLDVLDITNPMDYTLVDHSFSGSNLEIPLSDSSWQRYHLYGPNDYKHPRFVKKIENQNLHSIDDAEYIIIYHPLFEESVTTLKNHREEFNGLKSLMVDIQQIYLEFAAGRRDVTALRNFIKMVYDRSDDLKSVLLFGDASYDYRGQRPEVPYQNLVPTYETKESLFPLNAFPTDDYFALLSDNEGGDLRGALDISIGRIPVNDPEDAKIVVNKIITYDTTTANHGDWQLKTGFIADDEDNNIHLNQTESVINTLEQENPFLNITKVYLDAYEQVSTPGQARYPAVNSQINKMINDGALVVNYFGHGGQRGWAQERVLTIPDISSWENQNHPLMVTATCSFAAYDNPELLSPGELTLLSKDGVIGLLSTVRSVYSSQNFRLTRSVFETLFDREDGTILTIGEAFRQAKNANPADTLNTNARKFLLLGDPMTRLKFPQYDVLIDSINGVPYAEFQDTIGALERVHITGHVINEDSLIASDFNGVLNATLFDKPTTLRTQANDIYSRVKEFKVQKNLLSNREVNIQNGSFELEFIIPLDINYSIGEGKISLFASSAYADAKGSQSILVGGTNSDGFVDTEPPVIASFVNKRQFVSGDTVGYDPMLILDLSDNFAINYSGSSIGHDIMAQIDNDPNAIYILNDFFTPSSDGSSGTVEFQLMGLESGYHELTITAFDIANNVTKDRIAFFITDDADQYIQGMVFAPNPSSNDATLLIDYFTANSNIAVELSIYDSNGSLIDTMEMEEFTNSEGQASIQLDFSNWLPGIYHVFAKIKSPLLNKVSESSFERLVIIK